MGNSFVVASPLVAVPEQKTKVMAQLVRDPIPILFLEIPVTFFFFTKNQCSTTKKSRSKSVSKL